MTFHVYQKYQTQQDKVRYFLFIWKCIIKRQNHLTYKTPLEEYTALRDQWIRDGEGFLIVYSITSRSTYDRVNKFRDQIFRVKDVDQVPLILVGNKCDKVTDREVSREEGALKARTLNCDFVETSAKTCVNVERSFYSVVRLIRQQRGDGHDFEGGGRNSRRKNSNHSTKNGDKKCIII